MDGAEVVINLANSPTFDKASLDFFRTSMTNLLTAGERAGVQHQVILSIVNVDRMPQLVYYRAKALQEDLLRAGPTPYSIVRATQFFEFMDAVCAGAPTTRPSACPPRRIQPMAAADVVDAVPEVSAGAPLKGIRNVAGPDVFSLDELGRITLAASARQADRHHRRGGRMWRASRATRSSRARTRTQCRVVRPGPSMSSWSVTV